MRACRILFHLSCACLAAVPMIAQAQPNAAARKALLLGVTQYQTLGQAPSAEADLNLVEESLKQVGFSTRRLMNFKLAEMRSAVKEFIAGIAEGDEVFVYFSGVGLHAERDNFLLAADFDARRKQGFSLTALAQDLEDRNGAVKIIFVDAARAGEMLGESAGLVAPVEQTRETLIVFSQQYEQTLRDSAAGRPTAFATGVAAALRKPGLSISGLAEDVIVSTTNATSGRQQPVTAMQRLTRITYLRPPEVKERVVEKPVVVMREAELEPGASRELKKTGMSYAWIPPGEFEMGCVPGDNECEPAEKPRHRVRISRGFWITRTEVTAKSYQDFARATSSPMPDPTRTNKDWLLRANPVTKVPWDAAQRYCEWAGGRLPTEAEWEYAARGGKSGVPFPTGASVDHDGANYHGKGKTKTLRDQWDETTSAPVGSFDTNGWGLSDTAGNVREWVMDWFDAAAYASRTNGVTDPTGPASGLERVLRGGDFASAERTLRSSSRESREPSKADNRSGFRCVVLDWPK